MGCFQSSTAREVKLDFEGKLGPTSDEKLYTEIEQVLADMKRVYAAIEDYKGCLELVRAAMSKPTKENEQRAFEGLLGAVKAISMFFEFSRTLERILPQILAQLTPPGALLTNQATAKQFAQILDFTLRFDQTRMMRPNLSNDFSYYRRLLPKFSKHPGVEVKDDEASGMALFTAEHIPMMSTLAKATKSYIDSSGDSAAVEACLASIANSCMRLVKSKALSAQESVWLCLRAMTGAIVLYDHVTGGAFRKNSPINIRECINLLKKDYAGQSNVDSLVSAIQYSTVSFKTAPASIQSMFE